MNKQVAEVSLALEDLRKATQNHGIAHLKPMNRHQARLLADAFEVYTAKDDYYCARGHEKDLGYPCAECAKERKS